MTDTVPSIIEATAWSGSWVSRSGLGPRGLGPAPSPLPLATNRVFPSGETATAVGYQAVGMSPARRTTATSLLPALATYRVAPSGATASPLGLLPTGAPRYGAIGTVRTRRPR